jgi:hypothetical protein
MTTYCRIFSLVGLTSIGMVLVGCAREADSPAVVEEEVVEVEVPGLSTSGDANVTAAMAELDEADRAAATAQAVCPVSNEPLGSMGKPIKMTVKGRDLFICCESCREGVLRNPDKYLAKLDAKPAE